ncbi:hypothetical protein [uncultured Gimesia sp.]|uniref:hypothetical protein n=1 Tax=uncultured Gimesia sp. TaxID=1678688 RepID=UPI0026083B50|nr:hypothetical protein [uncultured Gimesia sp.]
MVRRLQFFLMLLTLTSFWVYGCDSDHADPKTDLPVPEAEPLSRSSTKSDKVDAQGTGLKEFDGIRFQVPEGWEQVTLSPAQQGLITASFRMPQAGNEITLTLSSVGGGIDANLQRWGGQFQLPPGETPLQESIRVDHEDAVWLDLRGTFDSGPAFNSAAESGMRMIGVAIPRSPRDFYLKLTGPREQLLKVEDEFRHFVKSARFVQ